MVSAMLLHSTDRLQVWRDKSRLLLLLLLLLLMQLLEWQPEQAKIDGAVPMLCVRMRDSRTGHGAR